MGTDRAVCYNPCQGNYPYKGDLKNMKLINSLDNKEVKYAAGLLQKKYRDREKCFLVEGFKSIQAAGRQLIETVFIDSS
ncbi:MAG TPA: hypothetical protein DD811_01680, partial [Syntrophomonas sp.]|nr:hypothetical protein [Syntrophomonas sp.]